MTLYEFLSKKGINLPNNERRNVGYLVKELSKSSTIVERLEPVMVRDYDESFLEEIYDQILESVDKTVNRLPKRKKNGFVYIVKCSEFTRIGYTTNPAGSFKKIASATNTEVLVLFCEEMIDAQDVHRKLIDEFSSSKAKNKNIKEASIVSKWWYKLSIGQTDRLLKLAKSLKPVEP